MRYSSPGHFQREHTPSPHHDTERNDEFPSWKSVFFWSCTGVISFAPLKSQGVDSRLGYIRENTTAAAPPPCSPKSIYNLASLVSQPPTKRLRCETNASIKLGIQPLCNSAFADIKSKVSAANVLDEVFSWVTARWVLLCPQPGINDLGLIISFSQRKIVEMECEVLVSNPTTIALLDENIGHISDGSSPHSAGVLMLGFKKAFELKKQKRSVRLQCPRAGCAWNTTPVSYSAAGSYVYCPHCHGRYGSHYMRCTGCSNGRISNSYASCQSCGRKFL